MKELSIPFDEEISQFKTGSNWNEFRGFSPTGLVPCLIDENQDKHQNIWDSLAIAEYLAERHPEIWPEGSDARAWARCASAEMHSGFNTLRDQCPMNCGVRVKLSQIDNGLQKDLSRLDELWNEGLNLFGGPFLAGEAFTAVDAFFAPVVFRIRTYGLNISSAAMDYVERILTLESILEWERDALDESWREPEHENETGKYGVITEDFRRA